MLRISYWIIPIFAGAVWLGMLLGLLVSWLVDTHRTHYVSMSDHQRVAYISDIGASHRLKPLFIAGCCVSAASIVLSFLCDRWLRHAGRLTPNGSVAQKTLAVLAIVFAFIGTAGLVLLSVFDVAHHKRMHDGFLLMFLGGYVLSAIFICSEYQRLGIHNREIRILRVSFWIKLSFVLIEVVLAIIFVCFTFTHHTTAGAIVEWVIAFIFSFYVFSFCIDLYPAVHTRHRSAKHSSHSIKSSSQTTAGGYANGSDAAFPGPATAAATAATAAAAPGAANGGTPAAIPMTEENHSPNGNSSFTRPVRRNNIAGAGGPVRDVESGWSDVALNGNGAVDAQQAYQPGRSYGNQ